MGDTKFTMTDDNPHRLQLITETGEAKMHKTC